MFTPIPIDITAYNPDVTGLDLLHKTKFAKMRQVEPILDLARISALIHDYYARRTKDPIHLAVDATLINAKMNLKAYIL